MLVRLRVHWITPIAAAGITCLLFGRNAVDFFNDLIWFAFSFLLGFVTVYGMVGHLTLWRFRIRYQAVSAVFSHIDRDLIIRSKAGRHSRAVLGLREIDEEETGNECCDMSLERVGLVTVSQIRTSTIWQHIIGNERKAIRIYLDNQRFGTSRSWRDAFFGFTTVPKTVPWFTRLGVSIAALPERKGNVADVEKYWLVCFVFSSAFSVLL